MFYVTKPYLLLFYPYLIIFIKENVIGFSYKTDNGGMEHCLTERKRLKGKTNTF